MRRPFAELPASLAGSILLQPLHERRHAALLATGRVWKTHVPASSAADQVVISYGADPGHELVWSWRTRPDVEKTVLRIMPARYEAAEIAGEHDPDLTGMRIGRGTSSLVRSPSVLNDPVVRRHVVSMTDLAPDTTYSIRLGDGSPGGWGTWRTAKTGGADAGRIEFLYMGDAQTGLEGWGRRLDDGLSQASRHRVHSPGRRPGRPGQRADQLGPLLPPAPRRSFERIPVMPCVGNHEYLGRRPPALSLVLHSAAEWTLRHRLRTGLSVRVGLAFFAVLDSTLAVSDTCAARLQAQWLDQALGRSHATWKFVMFHHPVYPSHPWRDTAVLRELWVPVFDKHQVDMVLQGHDHAYLRTYPMRGHHPVSSDEKGTTYIISVAGDKFCDQEPRDYIEVGFTKTSTYQTIEIDEVENRLTYRAWTDLGEVVDRLEIRKPRSTGVREIAGGNPALTR